MAMKKFIAALLFIPTMASAEFNSGNDLYADLLSESTGKRMYALGYLAGVSDAGNSLTHCIPSNVTLRQIQDMAINYLQKNADVRNLSADVIIGIMLMERWPCNNKGGKGI